MALSPPGQLLLDAQKGGYAVGAFNVRLWKWRRPSFPPPRKLRARHRAKPRRHALKYAPPAVFAGIVERLARDAKAPVRCTWTTATAWRWRGVRCGRLHSLMIDGSLLPYTG
jgi:tagatose 1,6-diphosphate aldolase GatY/KbaY